VGRVPHPLAPGTSAIPANVVVRHTKGGTLSTVYGYQIEDQAIADDHWFRGWLLLRRVVGRDTGSAPVRVASRVPEGSAPPRVLAEQVTFIAALHPELVTRLVRQPR
jgi:hypothetical protein